MRWFLVLCISLVVNVAFGQMAKVKELSLPAAIAHPENQVSGLYIANNNLYLLAESRLQDKHQPQILGIALGDLQRKLKDSSFALPYKSLPIPALEALREKMDASGNKFEGIESMVIDGSTIYFNIETNTPSPFCFLLRGILDADKVTLTADYFPEKRPRLQNGKPVSNAGFEAMAI